MDVVSDDSDDEDVEYMGHFCSECSIPPPGGVLGGLGSPPNALRSPEESQALATPGSMQF